MIVDAHQHFWWVRRRDYGWLTPKLGVLYRDYSPTDLYDLLDACAISATVLVQAAATESETRYLLKLAMRHKFIAGVVGWVDFERSDVSQAMSVLMLAGGGKLKALRPMVQAIADEKWLASAHLDQAFDATIAHDLTFDALVQPRHFPALLARLKRHPDLRAVIDHCGKPEISLNRFGEWSEGITELANQTAVSCKLSGLVTLCGGNPSLEVLAPYVEHVLKVFGPKRILWGSDWPVVNRAGDYASWFELARCLVRHYAKEHEEAIFGGNATGIYKLSFDHIRRPLISGARGFRV